MGKSIYIRVRSARIDTLCFMHTLDEKQLQFFGIKEADKGKIVFF